LSANRLLGDAGSSPLTRKKTSVSALIVLSYAF
jgi:outer membrane scaffolding protein for murein synthesis (MipA/OmpV family)